MKPYARHYDKKGPPGSRLARRRVRLERCRMAPLPPLKTPLLVHQHPSTGDSMTTVTQLPTAAPKEMSPEDMDALRERIRTLSEDDKSYSQARIAREADVSPSTFSQWIGGTYAGSVQNVAKKVAAWLRSYEERAASGGLPQAPVWVQTQASDKIMAGLRYAQLANDIVLIVGGAGVGKSKTIERYAQSQPNVWTVELSAATGGVIACLEKIAETLGIRDYARSGGHLEKAILSKIRNTNGLLILDEAQHMTVAALDEVRVFNDQGGIGLVLSGNERVYTQMTGGTRAPFLDRLYSRIGKKVTVRKSSVADADALIQAWGIEDAKCRDTVRAIAAKPGALRVLTKVLRLAAFFARAQERKTCCEDIFAAARELGVID